MYICACACVFGGSIRWLFFSARPLLIHFSHSFLCLSFSLTSISPSQPGAPSNRPLLCWLDFSLVNSPRLSVTSSRSLPTDYTLSLFFFYFFFINSLKKGWHDTDMMYPVGSENQSCLTGWGGSPNWSAFKKLQIYFWVYFVFIVSSGLAVWKVFRRTALCVLQ